MPNKASPNAKREEQYIKDPKLKKSSGFGGKQF
jgi:hypothetical protein